MEKIIILITLISLCFFIVLTIYLIRSRNRLKAANQKIKENADFIADQHEEILLQFEIIKRKNRDLSKYRDHLEKLDRKKSHKLISAKEKANESERLKSSLISNIYHEIRTPLNAIIGFVQLLSIEENIKNTQYISIIEKNADDLLLLVDNMIELSKIQSEKKAVMISEIKLKKFIQKIYNETIAIRNANNKNQIEINLSFNGIDDFNCIFSDQTKLYKIIKQLIDNALKYTAEGFITIGLSRKNNDTIISVSDTGIGIDESKFESIFNTFHKIEDHINLYRGIGIGLSIARQLAKQIGIEIHVESELKKGTKFILKVPSLIYSTPHLQRTESLVN